MTTHTPPRLRRRQAQHSRLQANGASGLSLDSVLAGLKTHEVVI